MAFLYTFGQYQGTAGKKTVSFSSMLEPAYCACQDKEGKIYNLAPLQRDDGKPRFAKQLIFYSPP